MRRTTPLWFVAAVCVVMTAVLAPSALAGEPESVLPSAPNVTELELGFLYSHFSRNVLVVNGYSFYDVIIIGHLKVDQIERDILIPSLTIRRGLSKGATIEAVIPMRYRREHILSYGNTTEGGQPTEEIFGTAGLGDIEVALNMDARPGGKGNPLVLTLGIKAATGLDPYSVPEGQLPVGTGHWGAKFGITTMKAYDPVLLFGSASFFWNMAREIEALGGMVVDPGDTFQYSLGMIYALSHSFTFNARIEQSFTGPTTKDGIAHPGSDMNAANLYLGVSFTSKSGSTVDVTVGAGLTEDSPDMTVKVSFPFRF